MILYILHFMKIIYFYVYFLIFLQYFIASTFVFTLLIVRHCIFFIQKKKSIYGHHKIILI